MKGQKVLVTGGAGFIGSNVCNRLAEDNHVIALDDCSHGTPTNIDPEVEFVEASVLDDDLPTNVDVVIHLAALSSYDMHVDEPQRGARVNVEGFVNVVEQARSDGCERVVYASSSSVDPLVSSGNETAHSAYEASKLARERYAEHYSNQHGMDMCGLRFFSVYGGPMRGEAHKGGYANVITQFAEAVSSGDSPVIYGDGWQTRDFTHVDDVARAVEAAADERLDGVYNVGTGSALTFTEVAERIIDELGADVSPTYVENPIDEDTYVHHTLADCSSFREETGWEPRIDAEEGIRRVTQQYE